MYIYITSNYRSIAAVSMDKIALWIHVGVDDWTIEWAIIASNVNSNHVDDWTAEAEWAIIASYELECKVISNFTWYFPYIAPNFTKFTPDILH